MSEIRSFVPTEIVTAVTPEITRISYEDGEMEVTGSPNIWLTSGSEASVIVDAGWGDKKEGDLFEKVWREKGKPSVAGIVITHNHPDHMGGAADLSRLTGAPIIRGKEVVEQKIDLGDKIVSVIGTPGHTRDSVCLWDPQTGALFTGDTILGRESVIVSHAADYMRSLNALRALVPKIILPGHGEPSFDGAKKIEDYIERTINREKTIIEGIMRGATNIEALVGKMYFGHQRNSGRAQIEAHLEKLFEEGVLQKINGELVII